MITKRITIEAGIDRNTSKEGEPIERKMERVISNKEKPEGSKKPIFQAREEGVGAGFDIRNDKWATAQHAMDAVAISVGNRRKARLEVVKEEDAGGDGTHADNSEK